MTYHVIDMQTSDVAGRRSTLNAALRLADRLDLRYGAIRYRVRPVDTSNLGDVS